MSILLTWKEYPLLHINTSTFWLPIRFFWIRGRISFRVPISSKCTNKLSFSLWSFSVNPELSHSHQSTAAIWNHAKQSAFPPASSLILNMQHVFPLQHMFSCKFCTCIGYDQHVFCTLHTITDLPEMLNKYLWRCYFSKWHPPMLRDLAAFSPLPMRPHTSSQHQS